MTHQFVPDRAPTRVIVKLFAKRWGISHLVQHCAEASYGHAIPMRDGTLLRADILRPHPVTDAPGSPLIIVRTPYGRRLLGTGLTARLLAGTGATVLIVSCRGTFDSAGEFEPFRHESADGEDTLKWVRAQAWGEQAPIVLWGASYEAYTQWATAAAGADISACIVQLGASSMRDGFVYQHGALAIADVLAWVRIVSHQNSMVSMAADLRAQSRERKVAAELPYEVMDERAGYGNVDWFRDWVAHGPDDEWWDLTEHRQTGAKNQSPTWHITAGWHDVYLQAALRDYQALRENGQPAHLVIGPWKHMDSAYLSEVFVESLELVRASNHSPRAKVWVTGHGAGWSIRDTWPPAARPLALHLSPGALSPTRPTACGETVVPTQASATPAMGGIRAFVPRSPIRDNKKRERRTDVQVFTGPELGGPLTVEGTPSVDVEVSATRPGHFDIHVRLTEVTPARGSVFVTEGFYRAHIGYELNKSVSLTMAPIAHRFGPGSRLRLQVAPGSFPTWGPNPGTDGRGLDVLGTWNLCHGPDTTSQIVLPIAEPHPASQGHR